MPLPLNVALQVSLASPGCVRAHCRRKAWKDNYAWHISTHLAKPGGERKAALVGGGGIPNYKAGLEPPDECRASVTHPLAQSKHSKAVSID